MIKNCLLLFIVFTIASGSEIQAGVAGDVNKANRFYRKGEYEKAKELYNKALEKKKKPKVYYNLGTNDVKRKDFESAGENFNSALNGSAKDLKNKINYNMGNMYYEKGDFGKSVEAWKNALIINPNDKDAKNNLEVGLKKLQLQQQQKNQDKNKDQKKDQEQDDKEKKRQQQEEEKKKQRDKEEAQRVLGMMENMEKEAQKKKQFKIPNINVEKDW